MTKPSRKKAANTRRKTARKPTVRTPAPKPVDVVETAPTPNVEELKADVAKFDHDGDGHPGGSLPHHAEAKTDEAAGTVAHDGMVSLGPVECRIKRLPTDVVLGLLDPDGLRRIEAEKSTASFESTRKRLLATDGRATPVIFVDGDPPSILHGFAELAAAEDGGVNEVSVILVPAGGASEAQSYIVEMVRQQRDKGKTSDDDELFYRVHAED